MPTIAELVRPVAAESDPWIGTAADIAETIQEPQLGDGACVVASAPQDAERPQIYRFAAPADPAFEVANRVIVKVLCRRLINDPAGVRARVRFAGVWTPAQTFIPAVDDFTWYSLPFGIAAPRNTFDDLAVELMLEADWTTGSLEVDALYALVQGVVASLDVSLDFVQTTDNLQPVLWTPGEAKSTPLSHGLRSRISTREVAASGGKYTTSDVTWHLDAAEVAAAFEGAAPRVGERITDTEGVDWTILHVHKQTWGKRWTCICRALAIVHGLNQLITIEMATTTKGPLGEPLQTWGTYRSGVLARKQVLDSAVGQQHDRRLTTERVVFYLAEEIPVDHRHRLLHAGQVYHVTGSQRSQQIDHLYEIHAERTPWPL